MTNCKSRIMFLASFLLINIIVHTNAVYYVDRCSGTSPRYDGPNIPGDFGTIRQKLADAPNGTVCIGYGLTASGPARNFMVLAKYAWQTNGTQVGSMMFLGTQSVKGGYIDFTEYVHWGFEAKDLQYTTYWGYQARGNCSSIPSHLLGTYKYSRQTRQFCSRKNPKGVVFMLHPYAEMVVDDEGAITVTKTSDDSGKSLWVLTIFCTNL